jgi:hypothetical protein
LRELATNTRMDEPTTLFTGTKGVENLSMWEKSLIRCAGPYGYPSICIVARSLQGASLSLRVSMDDNARRGKSAVLRSVLVLLLQLSRRIYDRSTSDRYTAALPCLPGVTPGYLSDTSPDRPPVSKASSPSPSPDRSRPFQLRL